MKLKVHGAHGRRWVITRPLLAWRPRLDVAEPENRAGGHQIPMTGVAAAGAPEVTRSMMRERAQRRMGSGGAPWPMYVALPIYLVKMLGYFAVAVGTLAWKEATRRPWTITAFSEHPKPIRHQEAVVGWRQSGRRARAIAAELRDGEGPVWAQ
jgi:hypothetical protein